MSICRIVLVQPPQAETRNQKRIKSRWLLWSLISGRGCQVMRTKPTRSTRHKIRLPTFRYCVSVCATCFCFSVSNCISISEGIHVTVVCVTRIFQLSCLSWGTLLRFRITYLEIAFALVLPIKALITELQLPGRGVSWAHLWPHLNYDNT